MISSLPLAAIFAIFVTHHLFISVSSFVTPSREASLRQRQLSHGLLKTFSPSINPLNVLPLELVDAETLSSAATVAAGSSVLLSAADIQPGEIVKNLVIFTWLFGGLIPALISANKSMMGTLSGKRRGGEDSTDKSLSINNYIESSGATGPTLPQSALMFPSEDIPLVDVIAVVGRLNDASGVCDWENLPSTKYVPSKKYTPAGGIDLRTADGNPIMWLPRAIFKENVRNSKFLGWPTDGRTGEPVGGSELEQLEKGRISKKGALIGDAALDAVFDSWANGASVATKDKVSKQLSSWRDSGKTFDLQSFTTAAIIGRAYTGAAAVTFIAIQLLALKTLILGPILGFFEISLPF
eukprot:CAMPEP_0194357260 /NCGR_PEP_ID=MMETSP0174-20130528/4766_1 /TAXON_ID=216777 /ORGANISM="Proboscia alata, Strain PI-D3" /LENGTH=352 /DNA_ID=CAMNT_0039127199 /DNA_START=260 /DNA_END=1318 /DNA_ORIENTATION=-